MLRGMAPRGKERTAVEDAALPAGKHRRALLRARDQHPRRDVLGEEWEPVAARHPASARGQAGCAARPSPSPKHPGKPALRGENHPDVVGLERAAPQRGEMAAIYEPPRNIRTQRNLRRCCFICPWLSDPEELHTVSLRGWERALSCRSLPAPSRAVGCDGDQPTPQDFPAPSSLPS